MPPNLTLSTEAETEIDPITYEVVRHGLWNANAEHVREIENLAVSQITVEIRDFQPCILTEDAELLYFGPCLQYMSGMLDMMTRYILEHRGERVVDGDMWLCNDPIIGTAHQPDVGLMCPVFVDGEVFCWVANISHQNDIGGTVPGSFCPNAEDAFWDPPCLPPFKIVEDNQIVPDMEALYRRCSRTPENLSLDLRATIAGNNAARAPHPRPGREVRQGGRQGRDAARPRRQPARLRSGARDDPRRRLLRAADPGGLAATATAAPTRCRPRSASGASELIWDNVGTHDQVGAINVGFAAWRGAILGSINVLMLPGQMGCIGGAARLCKFDPEPGTITAPDWGAAVSPAGVYATETAISLGNALVSKMMLASSDETMRANAVTPDGAQWPCHFVAGDEPARRLLRRRDGRQHARRRRRHRLARRRIRQRPLLDPRGPRAERRGLRGRLADPLPVPPRARRLRRRRPPAAPATAARSPTSRTRASPSSASTTNEGDPEDARPVRRRPRLDHGDAGDPGLEPARALRRRRAAAGPRRAGGDRARRSAASATASRSPTTTSSTGTGSARAATATR